MPEPSVTVSRLKHHAFRLREVGTMLEELAMASNQPNIAKYVLSHADSIRAMAELVDDITNEMQGIKA